MATKKNTKEITLDTSKVEKGLLKTKFPQEAKQIPQDNLDPEEINVLNKCINEDELTDEEFTLLKATLQKYRPALDKIKPEETIENIEKTVKLIQSEQDFLDFMDDEEEKYLIVNLPTKKGKLQFEFEVLPLTDSRVVEALEIQVSLFKDYSLEETATYASAMTKNEDELTPEEKEVLAKMNKDLTEKISQQRLASVDNFLAHQLKIKGSDADLETRRKFWKKFHFNAKFTVFVTVQERLGLTEISNKELFPFGE